MLIKFSLKLFPSLSHPSIKLPATSTPDGCHGDSYPLSHWDVEKIKIYCCCRTLKWDYYCFELFNMDFHPSSLRNQQILQFMKKLQVPELTSSLVWMTHWLRNFFFSPFKKNFSNKFFSSPSWDFFCTMLDESFTFISREM